MRALLLAIVAGLFSTVTILADSPRFIMVTVETVWESGAGSGVGEVEQVISQSQEGYHIQVGARRYVVPLANAKPITAEEAAVALLAQRAQLYTDLDKAQSAASGQGFGQPAVTQRNGRPLPRNWIDPATADRNFLQNQQNQELNKINRALNQK